MRGGSRAPGVMWLAAWLCGGALWGGALWGCALQQGTAWNPTPAEAFARALEMEAVGDDVAAAQLLCQAAAAPRPDYWSTLAMLRLERDAGARAARASVGRRHAGATPATRRDARWRDGCLVEDAGDAVP